MAGVAEGITVGGPEGLDPNNPDDFASILEGRGVPKAEGDESSIDTSIAAGLTVAEPGPPRDPATGKFLPKEAPAADTSVETVTDTSGEGSGEEADPVLEAFLAKYDGDVEKALKGAAHAQSLIGRRSEAEEALKERIAHLEGMVQGLATAAPAAAPVVRLSDDQVVEVATSEIERKGYDQAATEAANFAHNTGDERAYRTILEQWQLEDPIAAMDFNTDFRIWQRETRAAAERTPVQPPAWVQKVEEQAKIDHYGEGFKALKAELGDEAFARVASKLGDALEQMPPNVIQMIDSPDAEARNAGFRIVADRALRLAGSAPVAPVADPAAGGGALPPAVQRKLAGAAVASGALRPSEKAPEGAPQTREDAIREFKRQIVEAETTSIASGLTYGPTP